MSEPCSCQWPFFFGSKLEISRSTDLLSFMSYSSTLFPFCRGKGKMKLKRKDIIFFFLEEWRNTRNIKNSVHQKHIRYDERKNEQNKTMTLTIANHRIYIDRCCMLALQYLRCEIQIPQCSAWCFYVLCPLWRNQNSRMSREVKTQLNVQFKSIKNIPNPMLHTYDSFFLRINSNRFFQ